MTAKPSSPGMATITEERFYAGAARRVDRLGLSPVLEELRAVLTSDVVSSPRGARSTGPVTARKSLEQRFRGAQGWIPKRRGTIHWMKSRVVEGRRFCLGVSIHFSAKSEFAIIDLLNIRKAIVGGQVDVGVLIVPGNQPGAPTGARARMRDVKRCVIDARVDDLPLILIGLELDGPGQALAKRAENGPDVYPTGPSASTVVSAVH